MSYWIRRKRQMDAGAVMIAKRIREEVGVRDYRVEIERLFEHYDVGWAVRELPVTINGVCLPEKRVVVVASRFSARTRRFHLCHELIEVLYPTTMVHGSMYNEAAGHLLMPPWLISSALDKCHSYFELASVFDVSLSVVNYQLKFLAASHG